MSIKRHRTTAILLASLMLLGTLAGCKSGNRPTKVTWNMEATGQAKILFDRAGVKMTLTEVKEDPNGLALAVLVENSNKVTLIVHSESISVNGYLMDSHIFNAVDAGQNRNVSIEVHASSLEEFGICTVGTVGIWFDVLNSETWESICKTGIIAIETSDSNGVNRGANNPMQVLFERDGVKVSFIGMGWENASVKLNVRLFIENNRDKGITVHANDTSVNGFMVDGSLYCVVAPGKKRIDILAFSGSSLVELGIGTIGTVEVSFEVSNSNDWKSSFRTDVFAIETSDAKGVTPGDNRDEASPV